MMPRDDSVYAIQQRIYASPDVSAVMHVLVDAGIDDGTRFICRTREAYDHVALALSRITSLAEDDIETATELILHRVLPLLDVAAPEDAAIEVSQCRKYMIEWLDGFPATERMALEERILDYLLAQFATLFASPSSGSADFQTATSSHPESACWTIGAMGRRRDDVVGALWQAVTQYPNSRGDTALAALAGLGLPPAARSRVRNEAHKRLHARNGQEPSTALFHVLSTLADPSSIDVVAHEWLAPSIEGQAFSHSLALSILGAIADKADYPGALMNSDRVEASFAGVDIIDRAWAATLTRNRRIAPHLRGAVALGGDIVQRIDSAEVVSTLLRELAAEDSHREDDRALHGRYLLALRLSECVRPRQLGGWAQLPAQERQAVLERLREDAERDSGSSGRFQTLRAMVKEQAWQVALRLGAPEVFDWGWAAVMRETSSFKQRGVLELLATFHLADIPAEILALVREARDLRTPESDAHEQAQLGAIEVAASSATPTAFEALLDCGLRIGDSWLLDVSQALAAAAVERVRRGDRGVESRLWERVLSDAPDTDRTAAAFALEELAGHALLILDEPRLGEVIRLLHDEGRSTYQRALLVAILAQALQHDEAPLPAEVESLLAGWAKTDLDVLGWTALQTLVRFMRLIPYHEELLHERLDLEQTPSGWDFQRILKDAPLQQAYSSGSARPLTIVADLYRANPEAFAPAMSRLLRSPRGWHVSLLINALLDTHGGDAPLPIPARVAATLAEQAEQAGAVDQGVEDLLAAIARLLPEQIAHAPLAERARDWPTRTRTALADALGAAEYPSDEAQRHAVKQLLNLAGDGQYSVRRAAYRSLGNVMPGALVAACALWQSSPDADWRRLAAEASGWLAHDQSILSDEVTRLYQALRSDPERVVREDTERARQERRARTWANDLRRQLLEPRDWAAWDNALVLRLWRIGEAFVHLCDDTGLHELNEYLRGALPRHVRVWLARLYDEGQKTWKEVAEKWPAPWSGLAITYTVGVGQLVADNSEAAAPLTYITAQPADPAAKPGSAGALIFAATQLPTQKTVSVTMRLDDGQMRRVRAMRRAPISSVGLFELDAGSNAQ